MRGKDKIARLKQELAKGEADLKAGRYVVLESDADIEKFFAELNCEPIRPERKSRAKVRPR